MLEQAANTNQAAIAAGRMQLVKGQFHPLPWIDCTFNKILLVNVAYFFDSDGNDAAEVFRVLKSGGRLVVYVCACRKLNPAILVMQSAQDWATKNVPGAIDGARDRCIFL
jgi:SAM-dependent methyltransferase